MRFRDAVRAWEGKVAHPTIRLDFEEEYYEEDDWYVEDDWYLDQEDLDDDE